MSYLKVWIHVVWSTKSRYPFLDQSIRQSVFEHMLENAREKAIYIDFINGYVDHVHCLICLKANQTIAEVVQLIKGESAFWINKNNLTQDKFSWQNRYFAISVSESQLPQVRAYIKNQEAHHRKQSYIDEEKLLFERYGFKK